MKTTQPSDPVGPAQAALRAANDDRIEIGAPVRGSEPVISRGWDPYDVWRTRVKAPKDTERPKL